MSVVGSINVDLIVQVARLPAAGETVLGGVFSTAGGGKGANQAVAAARLGARVDLVACLGDDSHGRQMLAALRAEGISLGGVRRAAQPTGVAVILVDSGGQNVIAVASGANADLAPRDVEAAAARLARADTLVAQLEVPLDTVAAAAGVAQRSGSLFLLNAAPAQPDVGDLLRLVDVLVVNETELAMLSGGDVEPGQEREAAGDLLGRGPRAVVLTLGARGALVVDARATTAVPALKVEAVDTTAAGDAFVGALTARLRGLDNLVEASRFASAAGALACTRVGAQPSLPTASQVDALLYGSGLR